MINHKSCCAKLSIVSATPAYVDSVMDGLFSMWMARTNQKPLLHHIIVSRPSLVPAKTAFYIIELLRIQGNEMRRPYC